MVIYDADKVWINDRYRMEDVEFVDQRWHHKSADDKVNDTL